MASSEPVSFICCVNKEEVFRKHLFGSINLRRGDELITLPTMDLGKDALSIGGCTYTQIDGPKPKSLGAGYAQGEAAARNDLMVFIHQDVELHPKWREELHQQIKRVEVHNPNWGCLGVFGAKWRWRGTVLEGITTFGCGEDLGGSWGNHRAALPCEVDAVDSVVCVKRKGPPYFDSKVPTFHGAVEDLCFAMRDAGRTVWTIAAYTKHFSEPKAGAQLEQELARCAKYLECKWKSDVPSSTRIWEHTLALLVGRPVAEVCAGLDSCMM